MSLTVFYKTLKTCLKENLWSVSHLTSDTVWRIFSFGCRTCRASSTSCRSLWLFSSTNENCWILRISINNLRKMTQTSSVKWTAHPKFIFCQYLLFCLFWTSPNVFTYELSMFQNNITVNLKKYICRSFVCGWGTLF